MALGTINYTDFQSLINGTTGNPLANQELVDMVKKQELVIFDVDSQTHYIVIGSPENLLDNSQILKYMKSVFIGYEGIAKYLHIPDTTALKYINLLKINPIIIPNNLSCDGIYLRDEFDQGMENLAQRTGLDEIDAQLRLGITLVSFRKIKNRIPYHKSGKYLPDLVDALFHLYLPGRTFFTSRKAAIECFVNNFNQKNKDKIEIQFCNDCSNSDLHPASDQCVNCKKLLCPGHAHLLPNQKITTASPPKICQHCLDSLEGKK